jgi:hypothetical protein
MLNIKNLDCTEKLNKKVKIACNLIFCHNKFVILGTSLHLYVCVFLQCTYLHCPQWNHTVTNFCTF